MTVKACIAIAPLTLGATLEVWTKGGLVTICLLFVMKLATRRVGRCEAPRRRRWYIVEERQ